MAISLNYRYHQPEAEPEATEPKKILSPSTKKFVHWAILISAVIISYLIVFSKIIALQTEELFITSVYNSARTLTKKNADNAGLTASSSAVIAPADTINYDPIMTARLSGYILLAVERNGEAWYVNPDTLKRYSLGRPEDASRIMRRFGEGATHEFITGQKFFPENMTGKILIDATSRGETYYINPADKKAYLLGQPEDAFKVMRQLGLGISGTNLDKIEIGTID
jgi:hypothetical protein